MRGSGLVKVRTFYRVATSTLSVLVVQITPSWTKSGITLERLGVERADWFTARTHSWSMPCANQPYRPMRHEQLIAVPDL